MWEKDFEEFVRGSILGLAKAASGLIEQAFSVGAPVSYTHLTLPTICSV